MKYARVTAGAIIAVLILFLLTNTNLFHKLSEVKPRTLLAAVDGAGSQLIAYYPLDTTDGVDWSGTGYNASINGTITTAAGKVGAGALQFDGSTGYMAAGRIQMGTELSVSFWYNNTAQKTGSLTGLGYYFQCSVTWNGIVGCTVDGDSSGEAETQVSATGWHHVVFTSTGSNQILYIDGAQVATANETMAANQSEYLFIGNRQGGGSGGAFGGTIDDFRLYSRVLTSGEVTTLYGMTQNSPQIQGSTPPPSGGGSTGGGSTGGTTVTSCTATDTSIPAPTNARVTETYYSTYPQIEFYMFWNDNASDETGYFIERSTDGINYSVIPQDGTKGANVTSMVTRADQTPTYYYRVRAARGSSCSNPSNILKFAGIPQGTYYSVDSASPTTVTILWNDRSGDTLGYAIERSTDGVNFTTIKKQLSSSYTLVSQTSQDWHGNTKTFTDTGLTAGQTYYYRHAAYLPSSGDLGPYSTLDSGAAGKSIIAVTPGGAPASPTISASLSGTEVLISLIDNSNNETGFSFERSVDGGAYTRICALSWKNCNDPVLSNHTYTYRANAYSGTYPGVASAWVYAPPFTIGGAAAAGTTEWYVSKNATGNSSGDSWTNAWKDIDQINWSVIKPGHTLYIDGGTYDKGLVVYGVGTQSSPVKIKTGALAPVSSGHSGRVIMKAISFDSASSWVTIDGSLNPSYVPPTAYDLDSNINLEINGSTADGIFSSNPNGLQLKFIKITNTTGAGIKFNGDPNTGATLDNTEIYGVHIDLPATEGIYTPYSSARQAYDPLKITKTLIERTGDDAIFTGGTVTINGVVIRYGNPYTSSGHPDGIQTLNTHYLDVHNTTIYDRSQSSYMIISESATNHGDINHVRIYNNLFYYSSLANANAATASEGVFFLASTNYANNGFTDYQTWNDILVANNTFYHVLKTIPINMSVHANEVGTVNAANITVKNNLIMDTSDPTYAGVAMSVNPQVTMGANVSFENNIVAGLNKKIAYRGTIYNTAEDFNTGTGYRYNKSNTPSFVNLAGNDFHLSSSDIVARGAGANLSSFFTNDLDNTTRPSSGAWDVGAYQTSGVATPPPPGGDTSVILDLSFDSDDFTTKRSDTYSTIPFADASTYGNTADCQSAFTKNGSIFNQCPSQTTGPSGGGKALNFSGGAICDMAADYVAVPGSSSLTNLYSGTVAFYALHNNTSGITERLIDTFTASAPGTWVLQRDGDQYVTFTANTDGGAETDLFSFPTPTYGSWSHYALTWNGTTITAYYNGVYAGTYSMQGTSKLNVGTYIALGALKHNLPRNDTTATSNCYGYLGVNNGLTYVFPNAGFFTGRMDNIKMYNWELSASEIATLANSVSPANVVSVAKIGTGSGTVSGGGISCGKHCAEKFTAGTSVTLTATADLSSTFTGWSGACSGTGTCTVSASGSKQVTAEFTKNSTSFTIPVTDGVSYDSTKAFYQPSPPDGSIFSWPAVSTPSTAQRIYIPFNVSTAGTYTVSGLVNASSQANNSFWVEMDAEPTSEAQAWYVITTAGFQERNVTRLDPSKGITCCDSGYDTNNVPLTPYQFNLAAGAHKFYIFGREDHVYLKSITINGQSAGSITGKVGDFDGDGAVNSTDWSYMNSKWNTSDTKADLNKDGKVNTLDLVILIKNWTT